MNKNFIIIAAIIVVLGIGGYFVFGNLDKNEPSESETGGASDTQIANNSSGQYKSACDVYTLDIAKKYLGENARKGDTPSSDDSTEGEHVITSSCLYDGGADSFDILNIQLITAKTATGEEWNRNNYENSPFEAAEFGEEEPPKLQQISGVGDKAYWNPQLGQLQILISNGKYWLTIQGSINDGPEEIEQHKAMAQEIIANL